MPPIATLVIGTEFTSLVTLLAALGGLLTPGFSPTRILTGVLLVLTFVNRTRRALAESSIHR